MRRFLTLKGVLQSKNECQKPATPLSSRTEQASEISLHYTDLVACASKSLLSVLCNDVKLVSLLSQMLAQFYYCVQTLAREFLVSRLLLPSLHLHFLIQRNFSYNILTYEEHSEGESDDKYPHQLTKKG